MNGRKNTAMIIQKILFPQDNKLDPELFFRLSQHVKIENEGKESSVRITRGGCLCANTYFNSFSLYKWIKYTIIQDLMLNLRMKGNAEIRVFGSNKLQAELETQELFRRRVSFGEKSNWVNLDIPLINKYINVYFEIYAIDSDVMVEGGYFSTSATEQNDIRIGLDICTFNRYEYLERNISRLKETIIYKEDNPIHDKLEVFVVDNGNNTKTYELSDAQIHVFLQEEKGSTGGFTRGMLEIERKQTFTHCLLMDDDVYLYPEVLERLYYFLTLLKTDYDDAIIGGALMRMDIPYIQHESGALWNDGNIVSCKPNADMRSYVNVVENEVEEKTEYMGWWFCCIPLIIIKKRGYPLPVYFHRDDVEFGLRNPKQITLNGICTWHEPFESKTAIVNEYYDMRNMGILLTLYGDEKSKISYMKTIIKRVMISLFRYDYSMAELILRGVEDFLKGAEWITNNDGGNHYRELKKKDKVPISLSNAEEYFQNDYRMRTVAENKIKKLLRYIMLNGYFFKAKKTVIVSAYEPNTYFFWRAKEVYFYNEYREEYYYGHKNIMKFCEVIKRLMKIMLNVQLTYDVIAKGWAEKKIEYLSKEYWEKKLKT